MSLPRNLIISIRNNQSKIPVYPRKIRRLALEILKKEKVRRRGELTFSFVKDCEIKKLNIRYLKNKAPTDVLAFNTADKGDKEVLFADVVISVDTALRNADIFKTSPKYELNLYAIHGLLHLLGYNDNSKAKRKIMHKKELEYANT